MTTGRSARWAADDVCRGTVTPYLSALHAAWLETEPERRWKEIPGTLVFADVSGFTPLAERLARKGKVGAEELTDTLNTVFAELLEVAARFGGDCLKFGGDALLLAFTGPGDARRAAAAAHGMQRALRALRRVHRGAGLSNLGISMGVHSGVVDALLVGGTHRELVLTGPAVGRTLDLEAAASGGQILLDRSTSTQLDPGDVTRHDAWSDLLLRAPTAALPVPAEREAPTLAEEGIPVALRAHLDGEHKDGEHRLASIAFVRFGGTDALLDEMGAEHVAAALHDLVTLTQRCCAAHDVAFVGTDVDRDGGKLILASGVPSTSTDDEDRLLLTVRDLVDGWSSERIAIRAGVHRGRVFAVDLGSPSRRTFTVMGDAVNVAARVMGATAWGTMLATAEVLERRRTDFVLETVPPFEVKGKAQPIHAQRVGSARGRLDERRAQVTPLLGRDSEVADLRAAFSAAHQGEGRVIELVGDPGIGKSKLLAAVASLDHGLTPLAFEGGRYSLATPYFALRRGLRRAMGLTLETAAEEVSEALARLVADLAPQLEPWLPLLGVPLGLDLPDTSTTAQMDPSTRHTTLQGAVVELMGKVLAEPTLITIEDAHWLDAASCDLLRALVVGIERRPWVVLVTRRDVGGGLELPESEAVTRWRLQPLTPSALAGLADAAAGDTPLPLGVRERLVERSGGNPLFLLELVNATVSGSVDELPETIEAVVAATIDTLPGADRSLLRQASVLGGHLPLATLARMVGASVDRVGNEVARLAHFLEPAGPGTLRFRHILLRDVAYEGLPFRVRRTLHERAGEIIARSTDDPESVAELLSIHFDRAGRHEESWQYSRVAGARAQHNGASVEAAAFWERALAAARHLETVGETDRATVAESLGDAWELAGRYPASYGAYRLARRLVPGDPLHEARLCRKIGYVRDHEGRYAAAQRWFQRGIRELAAVTGDPAASGLRAELTTAVVSSMNRQGRHARAEPLIRSAIDEAQASGDRAALAHAYFVYDQILANSGRYQEANHSRLAAAIYDELGDHRGAAAAYNEMGNSSYWLGDWDEAVRCYERAIEADLRAGALVYNAIYLNNIGEIRSDQGRLDEAEALLQQALDLWTSGGWRLGCGWALSNLGRVAARGRRFDVAAERLSASCEVLRDIGADGMLVETQAREMELHVLRGDEQQALGLVGDLHGRARRLGLVSAEDLVLRLEGYARCQAGDAEEGWSCFERSLVGNRSRGAAYEAALSLEGLARAGRLLRREDAPVHAHEAATTFARLGVVSTPEVPLPG